jgi:hypothetical protein
MHAAHAAPADPNQSVLTEVSRGLTAQFSVEWKDIAYLTIHRRFRAGGKDSQEQVLRLSLHEETSPSRNIALALADRMRADTLNMDQARHWWTHMSDGDQQELVVSVVIDELKNQQRGLHHDEDAPFVIRMQGPKALETKSTTVRLQGSPLREYPPPSPTPSAVAVGRPGPTHDRPPSRIGDPSWFGELFGALEETEDPAQRILVTVAMVMAQHRMDMQDEWGALFRTMKEQNADLQAHTRELLASMSAESRASRTHAQGLQRTMIETEEARLSRARRDLERVRLERRVVESTDEHGRPSAAAVVDTEVKKAAVEKFGGILEQGISVFLASQGLSPDAARLLQGIPPDAMQTLTSLAGDQRILDALKSPGLQEVLNDEDGKAFLINTLQRLGSLPPEA